MAIERVAALGLAFVACAPSAPTPVEAPEPEVEEPATPSPDPALAVATAAAELGASVPSPPPIPEAEPGVFAALCPGAPEGMSCVRGGWFERGVDVDDDGCVQTGDPPGVNAEVPAARVWVDTFLIDQHEVTNAEYIACVEDGACRYVRALYPGFHDDDQPHTGGNWYDARDYCEWAGGRLPTEAEFEYAIRGPESERTPYGPDLVTCETAVIMDESGRSCGVPQRSRDPEKGQVLSVGSRPAGRYGLYDMVGNAEEWVADWWTPGWEACGEMCQGLNPLGPCDGADECSGHRYRSVRGGSWYWGPECATGYHRRRYQPSNDPPHHFGFRCARSLPEDL